MGEHTRERGLNDRLKELRPSWPKPRIVEPPRYAVCFVEEWFQGYDDEGDYVEEQRGSAVIVDHAHTLGQAMILIEMNAERMLAKYGSGEWVVIDRVETLAQGRTVRVEGMALVEAAAR